MSKWLSMLAWLIWLSTLVLGIVRPANWLVWPALGAFVLIHAAIGLAWLCDPKNFDLTGRHEP